MRDLLGDLPLRPGQLEAIDAALDGDTLAVLATGLGKTLVYRVVGPLLGGVTVVVSPTIALQADQLAVLQQHGPAAAMLNSSLSVRARAEVLRRVAGGDLRFLLLTPEQLTKDEVVDALLRAGVGLLVVDEAHCVSSWGYDFRPDYLALGGELDRLHRPRVLAMTATASPRTRREIVEVLRLAEPRMVVGEADRPEIWLGSRLCVDADAADAATAEVLEDPASGAQTGAAIVYVATRARTEQLAAFLCGRGHPAVAYHGGLPAKRRDQLHRDFRSGAARLFVATNAFGLGVDRPDVRLVVHADPPESLDAYYQEAGRAGRDGAASVAVLLDRPDGYGLRRYFAAATGPGSEAVTAVLRAVGPVGTAPRRPAAIAQSTGLSRQKVRQAVSALLAVGALREDRRGIIRIGHDDDDAVTARAVEGVRARRAAAETGVELVRRYAETDSCRRRLVLELLGEQAYQPCGNCDNCDAGHGGRIDDVPFAIGSTVRHVEWGDGVVQQYEQDRVTVRFEHDGYRTLALDVALGSGLLTVEPQRVG